MYPSHQHPLHSVATALISPCLSPLPKPQAPMESAFRPIQGRQLLPSGPKKGKRALLGRGGGGVAPTRGPKPCPMASQLHPSGPHLRHALSSYHPRRAHLLRLYNQQVAGLFITSAEASEHREQVLGRQHLRPLGRVPRARGCGGKRLWSPSGKSGAAAQQSPASHMGGKNPSPPASYLPKRPPHHGVKPDKKKFTFHVFTDLRLDGVAPPLCYQSPMGAAPTTLQSALLPAPPTPVMPG